MEMIINIIIAVLLIFTCWLNYINIKVLDHNIKHLHKKIEELEKMEDK